MKHFSILYISLFLLTGCGQSAFKTEVLDVAEPLVLEQPDSAVNILKEYSLTQIQYKADRARFALIYSEALQNSNVDITNDSLTGYAVQYYSRRGTDLQKARAYIVHSSTHWYVNNIDLCVEYALKARDYLSEDDHRYNADVCQIMGNQYFLQRSYHEAFLEWEEAAIQSEFAGDTTAQMYAYSNIGKLNLVLGNHEEGYKIFQKCLEDAISRKDTSIILSSRSLLAKALYNKSEEKPIAELKKFLFEGHKQYNKGDIYPDDLNLLAVLYRKEGKTDSARQMLQKWEESELNPTDKSRRIAGKIPIINHMQVVQFRRNFERAMHNYEKAIEYDEIYDAITDSIYFADKKNSIQGHKAAYKHKLDIEKLRQTETERSFVVLILIVSLLGGGATVLWLISRHRMNILKKEQELDRRQDILASLSNAKFELEQRINNKALTGANDGIALENLKKILGRINVLIEKTPRNKNENIKEQRTLVYDTVNSQYNGILDYLQKEYKLSQYELELCSMICMGFSNSSIRILLDHTNYNTIYNYRSSLKNKLGLAIEQQSLESFFTQVKQQLER